MEKRRLEQMQQIKDLLEDSSPLCLPHFSQTMKITAIQNGTAIYQQVTSFMGLTNEESNLSCSPHCQNTISIFILTANRVQLMLNSCLLPKENERNKNNKLYPFMIQGITAKESKNTSNCEIIISNEHNMIKCV